MDRAPTWRRQMPRTSLPLACAGENGDSGVIQRRGKLYSRVRAIRAVKSLIHYGQDVTWRRPFASVPDPSANRHPRRWKSRPDACSLATDDAPHGSHCTQIHQCARARKATFSMGRSRRALNLPSSSWARPYPPLHALLSGRQKKSVGNLMIERGLSREAFGKKIIESGQEHEPSLAPRIEIEARCA